MINILPDDVVIYIALVMDIPDVLELCKVNSRFNRIIYNNQKYWMNKLLNDFPDDFIAEDISKYGPDYKSYYRFHGFKTIVLNVTIDEYDEEEGDYEYTYGTANLTYHKNRDIKNLLLYVYDDLFDQLSLWGIYSMSIDEEVDENLEDMKKINIECFKDINVNTKSITVNFSSQDSVDDTHDSLSELLRESLEFGKYECI